MRSTTNLTYPSALGCLLPRSLAAAFAVAVALAASAVWAPADGETAKRAGGDSAPLPPGIVLRINGTEVPRQEFLDAMNEALGESYRETFITHVLLEQRAKQLGVTAAPAEIDGVLNMSISQTLGERFQGDQSRLEKYLKEQGLTVESWKRRLRIDTRYEVLAEKLAKKDRAISDEDLRRTFEDKYGKDGAMFRVRHIQKTVSVSASPDYTLDQFEKDKDEIDREARARAEEALAKIRAGETFDSVMNAYSDDPRKLVGGTLNTWKGKFGDEFDAAALALKQEEVSGVIRSSDGYRIIRCLEATKTDEVHAQHILFATGAKAKGRPVEATKKLADDTLAEIRKGANFTELAKERSEDQVTASRGGDLGWFGGRSMTKPFDQAAFALQPGQVSEVVRTGYGFHIIKLLEKRQTEDRVLKQILISTQFPFVKERRFKPSIEAKAHERLQAALDEMKASGLSFADLARKYSEDAATKEQGGLLQPYREGVYKGEFDDAVKSMKAGDPPRIVRDGSGNLHLVLVEGIVKTDFDAVKDALRKELLERPMSHMEKGEYVKKLRESAKIVS